MSFSTQAPISLTSGVTGTLPVANGGTGVTTPSFQKTKLDADAAAITSGTTGTTLTDISGLSLSMAAGESWAFRAQIFVSAASTTPQLKFAVHGTAAAAHIRYQSIGNDGGLYPLSSLAHYQAAYDSVLTNTGSLLNTITIWGEVTNGASASVLTIQIAQNVSSADAIQVKADSNLIGWRKDV